MQQVYLDINGDILNEILGLQSENRIDTILKEIIEESPTGTKKRTTEKKETKKESKGKKKEKVAVRMIKLKRV